jgi:hypothetical protein
MALSEHTAARSGASATFTPELADDAQVEPQLTTFTTVVSNVAVNGLLAHHRTSRQSVAADDLSGAPQVSQSTSDGAPISTTIAFVSPASPSPGDGILLGLLGTVGTVISGGVTT